MPQECIIFERVIYLILAICLSLAFTGCKAIAWHLVFRAEKINLSLWDCLRIFSISCLVDVLLFPSTVSGDIFKIGYLHKEPMAARLRSIVVFRVATSLAYICFVAVLLSTLQIALGAVLFLTALFVLRNKIAAALADSTNSYSRVSAFAGVFVITLLVVVISFLRTLAVAAALDVFLPMSFIFEFVLSYCSGVISTVPMGLGVRDLFLGSFLVNYFNAENLAYFLVLHRVSGEGVGALIGWIFAAEIGFKKVKDYVRRGKEDKDKPA